jgi:hypothetical protein
VKGFRTGTIRAFYGLTFRREEEEEYGGFVIMAVFDVVMIVSCLVAAVII